MAQVIVARPPNFDELARVFPIAGQGVLFAWGDIIYNPMNVFIAPQLLAHEATHGLRQRNAIEEWWRRYVDDTEFRLREEVVAHRAEFRHLVDIGMNRHQRRTTAKKIAKRLSGPMYGNLLSQNRALELITQ